MSLSQVAIQVVSRFLTRENYPKRIPNILERIQNMSQKPPHQSPQDSQNLQKMQKKHPRTFKKTIFSSGELYKGNVENNVIFVE